jgi:hypothetical protein
MANSIPKKRAKAEQLRKKRAQAASAMGCAAKVPPRPIVVAAKRSRPPVGLFTRGVRAVVADALSS